MTASRLSKTIKRCFSEPCTELVCRLKPKVNTSKQICLDTLTMPIRRWYKLILIMEEPTFKRCFVLAACNVPHPPFFMPFGSQSLNEQPVCVIAIQKNRFIFWSTWFDLCVIHRGAPSREPRPHWSFENYEWTSLVRSCCKAVRASHIFHVLCGSCHFPLDACGDGTRPPPSTPFGV